MSKLYYRALTVPVLILLMAALSTGHIPQTASAAAPPALKQMEENLALVAEKITPAVVNISVSKK